MQCNNIYAQFGNNDYYFWNFSCSFEIGRISCILGKSGVGKSSFLRLLLGLSPLEKGSITYNGKPLSQIKIHYIPQKPLVLNWLSLSANITYTDSLLGRKKDAKKLEQALEISGLEKATNKKPSQLSGGEKQKLAIARAIYDGCELLLLDEAFCSLDFQYKEELLGLVKTAFSGKSMIFITHDRHEALALADSVSIFHEYPIQISQYQLGSVSRLRSPSDVEYRKLYQSIFQ